MSRSPVNMVERRAAKMRLLALETALVLRDLGGAAHLTVLTEVTAAQFRGTGRAMPIHFPAMIHEALTMFEGKARHFAKDTAMNDDSAIFFRPFGPDSNRWELRSAYAREAILAEVDALLTEQGVGLSADEIDAARRRYLDLLGSGDRGAAVDLGVLDELARRRDSLRKARRH